MQDANSKRRLFLLRLSLGAAAAALPWLVFRADFDAAALAACGPYGYGCSESACFTLEISTDYGDNWQAGSVWIYGAPGSQIDLFVRTTMTLNVNQVEAWSIGVKHSAPTLDPQSNGGSLVLSSAGPAPELGGVQSGAPPDLQATRAWTCGFTQGVILDIDGTLHKLGPLAGLATAHACYRLTVPSGGTVHTATINFDPGVGAPPVALVVSRLGLPIAPCSEGLTLNIQPTYSWSTPGYCPLSASTPDPCP
jgi:hypothetical protein